jgi:hypothetical protein
MLRLGVHIANMIKWTRLPQPTGYALVLAEKSKFSRKLLLGLHSLMNGFRIFCGYNGEVGSFYTNAPGRDYRRIIKFDKKTMSGIFISSVSLNKTNSWQGYLELYLALQCRKHVLLVLRVVHI